MSTSEENKRYILKMECIAAADELMAKYEILGKPFLNDNRDVRTGYAVANALQRGLHIEDYTHAIQSLNAFDTWLYELEKSTKY